MFWVILFGVVIVISFAIHRNDAPRAEDPDAQCYEIYCPY